MAVDWDLAATRETLSRAALDDAAWLQFIEAFARSTQSYGAATFPVEGLPSPTAVTASMIEPFGRYVAEGWFQHDERYLSLHAIKRLGVGSEQDFISPERMSKHPYYQDFLAPYRLRWFAGVGVAFGDTLWSLSLQRSIAQGPYLPEELNALRKLTGAISSAAALRSALVNSKVQSALAAFEMAGRAVILLNRLGNVVGFNPAASNYLGTSLQVQKGRLVSADPDTSTKINAGIGNVIHGDSAGMPVRIPRPQRSALIAHLFKPPRNIGELLIDCSCIVTLIDTEERRTMQAESLVQLFGLTTAEARLAISIAAGTSLEMAAASLSVTYETARTQLKQVFWKLGVKRQQELVHLLTLLSERTPT